MLRKFALNMFITGILLIVFGILTRAIQREWQPLFIASHIVAGCVLVFISLKHCQHPPPDASQLYVSYLLFREE